MSDLQSTQPRPIKVTDSVPDSDRADVKALENAKTGKVTAVVVVMHLHGNTKSRSINDNAKISAKKTKLESKSKKLGLN
jgi:ribosomal silencing factor RsfS